MINLESRENTAGLSRIVLEEDAAAGVYILVYETPASVAPERDYLQDTLEIAQEMCLEDFSVPLSSWRPLEA